MEIDICLQQKEALHQHYAWEPCVLGQAVTEHALEEALPRPYICPSSKPHSVHGRRAAQMFLQLLLKERREAHPAGNSFPPPGLGCQKQTQTLRG